MNEQKQGIISGTKEQILKRKRGCPRRDDNVTSGNNGSEENESSDDEPNVATDDLLSGQVVSGILSGSFADGYFVTVKPQHRDITLTGLIFCPGKVLPITPENDLAPKKIMYKRISPANEQEKNEQLVFQAPSTSASKSESQSETALLTLQCDQGYEFGMSSYNYPSVESLQDYRIVDHDEIMQEFEASASMNAPSTKPTDYRMEPNSELPSVYPETINNAKEVSENQEVNSFSNRNLNF